MMKPRHIAAAVGLKLELDPPRLHPIVPVALLG
jgi:hypothetical protein